MVQLRSVPLFEAISRKVIQMAPAGDLWHQARRGDWRFEVCWLNRRAAGVTFGKGKKGTEFDLVAGAGNCQFSWLPRPVRWIYLEIKRLIIWVMLGLMLVELSTRFWWFFWFEAFRNSQGSISWKSQISGRTYSGEWLWVVKIQCHLNQISPVATALDCRSWSAPVHGFGQSAGPQSWRSSLHCSGPGQCVELSFYNLVYSFKKIFLPFLPCIYIQYIYLAKNVPRVTWFCGVPSIWTLTRIA